MLVAIEGSIGAGKSSLLGEISSRGYEVFKEPVEAWTLLANFYSDIQNYALPLQLQNMASYAPLAHRPTQNNLVISERSPHTALGVFIPLLQKQGALSSDDVDFLKTAFKKISLPVPDVIVYLQASSSLSMERIAQRNREGEGAVTEGYLRDLTCEYARYLTEMSAQGTQIFRIDASVYQGRLMDLADDVDVILVKLREDLKKKFN
jgi:deoxyadenosine/deoxycytidine kinase